MERMSGGQDTRARWKSAVLALPEAESRSYLRDVEGFEPDQIGRLLSGQDATIVPADWEVTAESKAALARFEAWEKSAAAHGNAAAMLEYAEERAAAQPHQHEPTTNSEHPQKEDR